MKIIKYFEDFAYLPLDAIPEDIYLNYYICNKCNMTYANGEKMSSCTNCADENLKKVSKDEFFNFLYTNAKGKKEKIEKINAMRDKIESNIVPFYAFLKRNRES